MLVGGYPIGAMGMVYSMQELEKRAGVPSRTVREWIRKRLLAKPLGAGRGARYTDEHVARALLIQRLRARRQSLRQIAAQLNRLTPADTAALLALPEPQPAALSASGVSTTTASESAAQLTGASQWHVWQLDRGVVLMVNAATAGNQALQRAESVWRAYSNAGSRERM
jgi:DNA-binding transcriptional MerR regulator